MAPIQKFLVFVAKRFCKFVVLFLYDFLGFAIEHVKGVVKGAVFNLDAFDHDGPLWFHWTVLHATPPITIEFETEQSHIATVKKANGNGKMNAFTIEVEVVNQSGTLARYLIISDGGQLTVMPQPLF